MWNWGTLWSGHLRDKSSRGDEEEREKKGGHTVSCKTSMCANGSRKRILILILHTQILLFSPTGLCYPTLRRQKAKPLLMFLTPADPFLCESSFPSGCREWKFSRDWLIPRCTAPRGRLQRWLYWDEAVQMTLLAREKPVASVRCFVLQPTSFMFWGKTESDGGRAEAACGDFPWIWLLSNLFPWDKHSLLRWKKMTSCVGISNIMCHY